MKPARANQEVEDDSAGIAPNDLPHVFEPFYITNEASRKGHRADLGLAIAKRLMELQKGSIEAINVPSRNGATFRFHMPLSQLVTPNVIDS